MKLKGIGIFAGGVIVGGVGIVVAETIWVAKKIKTISEGLSKVDGEEISEKTMEGFKNLSKEDRERALKAMETMQSQFGKVADAMRDQVEEENDNEEEEENKKEEENKEAK